MAEPPTGRNVPCPECDATATAVIPRNSDVVASSEDATGTVRVDCRECGTQFRVHYRID